MKPVEEATIRKSRIVQTPTDKESLSVPNTIDQVVLSAKGNEVMAAQNGDESLLTKAVMPPLTDFKTCTQCGNLFLEYKHGNTKPNKCKECVKANISDSIRIKNIKKKFEADADQYAKDHPENLTFDDDPPPMLTLMFSQKRDARVYEAICVSAENDRRTPENQVLHFLEMALNGFASDVVFALEEPITREG